MSAHGADLGSIVAHVDVAAVAADPHGLLTGGEDHVVLQVGQQLQVALLVLLLDDGDPFEQSGDAVEPSSRAVSAISLYMVTHS